MNYIEIVIIAVALAMDAFAASITKGICIKNISKKQIFIIALFFGGFQAFMPIIGYIFGTRFIDIISKFDYIVAFSLLSIIGIKMILEVVLKKDEGELCKINQFIIKDIFYLAIATSIDALAIGVAFSLTQINIFISSSIIGIITFIISFIGVYIGRRFGDKYEKRAEIIGGLILIFLGLRIFISHFI